MSGYEFIISELSQFAEYVGLITCEKYDHFLDEDVYHIYAWEDPTDFNRYVLLYEDLDELWIRWESGRLGAIDHLDEWRRVEPWNDYFGKVE